MPNIENKSWAIAQTKR